jgi:hypothetical protein
MSTVTVTREHVIPELLIAIAAGECHWPADVRFDEQINLLTLTLDTLGQFAAWANHLQARRDKPIAHQKLIHGAHTTLLGWDVALWTYTEITADGIDQLTKWVQL